MAAGLKAFISLLLFILKLIPKLSSQPDVIAEHWRRYETKNTLKALFDSVFVSIQKSINLGFFKRSAQKVDRDSSCVGGYITECFTGEESSLMAFVWERN